LAEVLVLEKASGRGQGKAFAWADGLEVPLDGVSAKISLARMKDAERVPL